MLTKDNGGLSGFGPWLKKMLEQRNMSQADFARDMETSEACVSRWINGSRVPGGKQLIDILDYFDYHAEFIKND